MCLFKDTFGNQWCFKFQSPMLTAGWTWKQSTSDGWIRYQIAPYFKPAFYLKSQFTLPRLHDQQITFQMPEFTTESIFSFLFSQTGQVCVGTAWSVGNIYLQTQAKFTNKDCYKTIFNDLCDWSQLTSDRAMWLDYCTNEQSPQTINIMNWQVGKSISS